VGVELKECRFCGDKPDVFRRRNLRAGGITWRVCCAGTSCSVRPTVGRPDEDDAIASWNKRMTAIGLDPPVKSM
jgi:hypothetical protein